MFSNRKLQTAVRLGLGIGAGALAVGFAPGVMAQGADSADEVLEEIITTGSRIKRADLDSASPVTVIDREVLLSQGIIDVGNLLQRMPSMSGSPIGTTTNNGGNGSVRIDLRGMGVDRTLTLVNGKRTVDFGDYQTIPANMIERVEILKDGASAIYGADAVAGVVNIITRRDFEGLEFTLQTSDFFDMDSGGQDAIGLIAGKQFDGGNVVFGAEFVDQTQAFQSDAPWDYFGNFYYIYPEGCEAQVAAPYDGTATSGCYPIGSSRIPQTRIPFFSVPDINDNGTPSDTSDDFPNPNDYPGHGLFLVGTAATTPYAVGLMELHDLRTYNYSPVNYIQTPYSRTNLFTEAHFDITDTVRFNVSVRGNFRQSAQELAPVPFTPGDPMYNGFFVNPTTGENTPYTGISENNYYLRAAIDAYNLANGTALTYEPVVGPRRRMIETKRRFTQDITQIQAVVGLEGTFNDMDWEVHYNRGYRSRTDVDSGQFSGARLFNAMGPSADLDGDGQPECYASPGTDAGGVDATTLIQGCVPMNFFGGGEVDPITSQPTVTTMTQDMLDYTVVDLIDTFTTTMDTASASLTGAAFDLPGGQMGWAVGLGYWGQTFVYAPDSGKQTGAVTGNVGAGTDGALYNTSVYAEVLLPVMDNGSQAFTLSAGVRYDDWNAFDSDTTWQLGVEFNAIDSLKLRATAGTIFRAPTVDDLFGGIVDSFPTFVDPCAVGQIAGSPGCAQIAPQFDTQVNAKVGGNPFLTPETGETFTAGIVWSPEFGDADTTLTLDYWQVDIEDGISSLGVNFTLTDCYVNQNASSCALITRNADYTINNILDGSINVADQGAKGVDTEIRFVMDSDVGQWEAALLWSHLLERTKTPKPGDAEIDLSDRYTDPTAEDGGAYAVDKFNYSIQWARGDLSIGYLGEYISGLTADTFCNCERFTNGIDDTDGFLPYFQNIDSQLYHDIVVNYTFEATGTNIAAGITNLTDEAPPYIEVGFNASTDPATYRLFGRGYYVRLTQSFE
ncbi:MAG: TonB-dependent receptor [Proteobacteria bacterium]|nr:TonB-dependent receptor [Pseudomonadota bacterium]